MLYIVPENVPTLFVCLTFDDYQKLRAGNTLFVDPRMTGGRFFNQFVISLHESKDQIVKLLLQVQPNAKIPEHLPEPPPHEGEYACAGCNVSNSPDRLFEDRCIICWANEAKRFRV